MALSPERIKALALELAAAMPPLPPAEVHYAKHEETVFHYVEAALLAHQESFGEDEEKNCKMQWLVTASLERAVDLLKIDVYGAQS